MLFLYQEYLQCGHWGLCSVSHRWRQNTQNINHDYILHNSLRKNYIFYLVLLCKLCLHACFSQVNSTQYGRLTRMYM